MFFSPLIKFIVRWENAINSSPLAKLVFRLINVVLLVIIILYSLYILKKEKYSFDDPRSFLLKVGGTISSWVGAIGSAISILVIIIAIIRGGETPLGEKRKTLKQIGIALGAKIASTRWFFYLQIAASIFLFYKAIDIGYSIITSTNTAGRIVVIHYRNKESVFQLRHQDSICLTDTNNHILSFFPLHNTSRVCMAVDINRNKVYAADYYSGYLHIIDFSDKDHMVETDSIYVGRTVSVLTLNADGKKLYVAICGGGETVISGSISVYDLTDDKPKLIHSINDIGYPISICIPSNSKSTLLFEASQGWHRHDQLFVIDTKTDIVMNTITLGGIAHNVFATQDGNTAFVSAGDTLYCIRSFTTAFPIVNPVPVRQVDSIGINCYALAPDDRTLLISLTVTRKKPGKKDSSFYEIRSFDIQSQKFCTNISPMKLNDEGRLMVLDPSGNILIELPDKIVLRKAKYLECNGGSN